MASLRDILANPEADWTRRDPASADAIRVLQASVDFTIPPEYLTFLQFSNGGDGDLCIEPWCFRLESAESVIDFNRGYQVEKFLPGFFAIGSSGGGEMLAIRKEDGSPCPIYMVPFIPMAEGNAAQIAFDFKLFAMCLGLPPQEA